MHSLSAIELRDSFLRGDRSAYDITSYFLTRIEKCDDKIGAFLSLLSDRALARAKMLDAQRAAGQKMGKMAAIPVAIKDNIHIKGEISTCGSRFLVNYRAPFDATATRLLESEGAILIGKTNMDEFAMGSSTENSALQRTFNPWNLRTTPGGSSGGSAAAVAARMVPMALGSDTGGSIRQPAAFCGIVGFKPTYGRVSRYGLVAFGSSLDQVGPFAANSADAALAMEVLGCRCEKDSTSLHIPTENYLSSFDGNISGLRVGVPWQFLEQASSQLKENFNHAIKTLQQLGATIVDVDLSILKYSISIYYILSSAEASTNLARFDGVRYGLRSSRATTIDEVYDFSKEEGFGPEVKRRILLGTYVLSAGYQDAYYKKAQKVRALIISHFKRAFTACDVVATPTVPFPAFDLGSITEPMQMYLNDIYSIGPNLAGLPAVSIPSGFTADKMPLGLQLIGPQCHDVALLRAANALEKATNYNIAPPQFSSEV